MDYVGPDSPYGKTKTYEYSIADPDVFNKVINDIISTGIFELKYKKASCGYIHPDQRNEQKEWYKYGIPITNSMMRD